MMTDLADHLFKLIVKAEKLTLKHGSHSPHWRIVLALGDTLRRYAGRAAS